MMEAKFLIVIGQLYLTFRMKVHTNYRHIARRRHYRIYRRKWGNFFSGKLNLQLRETETVN